MSTFDTDPHGESAEEIERTVDQDRSKISDTIDQLQDRMSVGNLVQDVVSSFNKHGGDVGRNLTETVKNNPIPVILTGVGLAWLMAGSGRSASGRGYGAGSDVRPHHLPDHYTAEDSSHRLDVGQRNTTPTGQGAMTRPTSGSGDGPRETSSAMAGSARDAASSAAGGARDAASRAKDRVGSGYDSAKDRVGEGYDSVADAAGRARDAVGDGYDRASEAVDRTGRSLRRSASEAGQSLERGGRRAHDEFDRMMDEQPLVLGALALAVGAAIGGALPRTRREDEMFGAESDRAWDAARDEALDQAEKAKAVGERVADEAVEMADEAAGEADANTPSGREAVEKAEGAARGASNRLAEAAKDEAGKQKLGETSGGSGGGKS